MVFLDFTGMVIYSLSKSVSLCTILCKFFIFLVLLVAYFLVHLGITLTKICRYLINLK